MLERMVNSALARAGMHVNPTLRWAATVGIPAIEAKITEYEGKALNMQGRDFETLQGILADLRYALSLRRSCA